MLVWLCLRSPSATASMLDTCDSMPIFTALGAVPENTDAGDEFDEFLKVG